MPRVSAPDLTALAAQLRQIEEAAREALDMIEPHADEAGEGNDASDPAG